MRNTIQKPPVHRITGYQLLLALLLSALLMTVGTVQGYSFLAGSLIQIAGSAYFAWQAFKFQGAQRTALVVRHMYQGEAGKIVLSATLFVVTFVLIKPLDALYLFLGYVVLTIGHALIANRLTQKKI